MADYPNVPALRRALSSDDPDRRTEAYGAVLRNDIEPSAVMSDDPPEDALVEAGVVEPSDESGPHDSYAVLIEIRDLLREHVGGDDGST